MENLKSRLITMQKLLQNLKTGLRDETRKASALRKERRPLKTT